MVAEVIPFFVPVCNYCISTDHGRQKQHTGTYRHIKSQHLKSGGKLPIIQIIP